MAYVKCQGKDRSDTSNLQRSTLHPSQCMYCSLNFLKELKQGTTIGVIEECRL